MEIENAFSLKPLVVKEPLQIIQEDKKQEELKPFYDQKLSVKQNLEREKRIIFVGNIPIDAEKSQLVKFFKQFGKVKKLWIRSTPTDPNIKQSIKVKVIKGQNIQGCLSKNCYVLYEENDSIKKAIEQTNNKLFQGRHLHVTQGDHIEKDFKTTIFVGNLPYDTDEEELRDFFKECGTIEYVRIIRDKFTFKSHGFCYVKFQNKEAVLNALQITKTFKERQLRISKAKKAQQRKKKQVIQNNAERRISAKKLKKFKEQTKELSSKNVGKEVIDKNTMERIFQHNAKVPQTVINKKIKKLKKKGYEKFEFVEKQLKVKEKAHKKISQEVFEQDDLLKQRREKIKRRKEKLKKMFKHQNKKKVNQSKR